MPPSPPSPPTAPKDAPIRLWFDATKQRWTKQIGGRRYRFGPANCDYWTAYEEYVARFGGRPADLRALQRQVQEGGTIAWLLNQWCLRQLQRCRANEISTASWRDYQNIATEIAEAVGHVPLRTLDGQVLRQLNDVYQGRTGPQRRKKLVMMLRRVLHWGRIEKCLPIPNVGEWQGPSKKEIRDYRANADHLRNLSAAAIHDVMQLSPSWLRACILLGINCGYSNTDVANLRFSNLKRAGSVRFIDYPRPKTSIERVSPMWPETIEAVQEAIDLRVKPEFKELNDLVFLSSSGRPIDGTHLVGDRPIQTSTLAQAWAKARSRSARNEVGGFRLLRGTFSTIAHESEDAVAVDYLMGHATREMRNVYVGGAAWPRLVAITDHVREWFLARGDIAQAGPRPGDGLDPVQTGW